MDAFHIRRLQPNIGAEISGVDLGQELDDEIVAQIREAWVRYGVIFFHDQDIEREAHVRFGRLFGELIPPVASANNAIHPDMHLIMTDGIDNAEAADTWHADLTCFPRPSSGSILRCYAIPSLGGNTMWSNAAAAYAGLDSTMKDRLVPLRAVHDVRKTLEKKADPAQIAGIAAKVPPVIHPVVRVHPVTRELVLYVNEGFTTRIVGMSDDDSSALLRDLFDQIKRPEYQLRFAWRPNSIAFWDNRKVQHYAVNDYCEPRHLESVVLLDDAPFGMAA